MKTIKPIGLLVLLLFLQCGYSQIKYKAEKTIINGDSAWKLVVEKGYTWYGISKSFSVPIQVIKNHNPQDSVLKTGAVLFFPLYSTQVPDSNHTLLNDTITGDTVMQAYQNTTYTLSKGRPLQISLFLPFSFNNLQNVTARGLVYQKKNLPRITENMLSYYRGLKFGFLNSKIPVGISVYDTGQNDTNLVKNWILNSGFQKSNIIIGPVHSNPFKIILKARDSLTNPIIYPFIQNTIKVDSSHNLLFPLPGIKQLIEGLADYCVDSLTRKTTRIQINIEDKTDTNEINLVKIFINRVNKRFLSYKPNSTDTLTLDKPNTSNVIAVFSSNETYLSKLVTQLAFNRRIQNKILCSHIDFSKLDNIDAMDLNKINFTFASPYDLTYYQNELNPSLNPCENEYYQMGESLARMISKQLKSDNTQIDFNWFDNNLTLPDLIINHKYSENVSNNGLTRNQGVFIFRFYQFNLRKVNWNLPRIKKTK